MTQLAESYYQGRAEQFQIPAIPPILSGQPVPLSPESTLAIHTLSAKANTPVSDKLQELFTSMHGFLPHSLPEQYRELVDYSDEQTNVKNADFARRALFSTVVPKSITTGKVRNATIEAIARPEVNEKSLAKLRGQKTETTPIDESHEVYFRLQGEVRSGAKGSVKQGLAIVSLMFLTRKPPQIIPNAVVPIHYGIRVAGGGTRMS
ncbi:MAG TPA: hypothetical protein VJR27_00110 [Candidatus Saccharimonadales bacterium]|nr:hypothetical protein [Candidatus Saccharimonadales bacterium]